MRVRPKSGYEVAPLLGKTTVEGGGDVVDGRIRGGPLIVLDFCSIRRFLRLTGRIRRHIRMGEFLVYTACRLDTANSQETLRIRTARVQDSFRPRTGSCQETLRKLSDTPTLTLCRKSAIRAHTRTHTGAHTRTERHAVSPINTLYL